MKFGTMMHIDPLNHTEGGGNFLNRYIVISLGSDFDNRWEIWHMCLGRVSLCCKGRRFKTFSRKF